MEGGKEREREEGGRVRGRDTGKEVEGGKDRGREKDRERDLPVDSSFCPWLHAHPTRVFPSLLLCPADLRPAQPAHDSRASSL